MLDLSWSEGGFGWASASRAAASPPLRRGLPCAWRWVEQEQDADRIVRTRAASRAAHTDPAFFDSACKCGPRRTGTNVIVTDGHSGLGLETTRALAKAGAAVTFGLRNPDRSG